MASQPAEVLGWGAWLSQDFYHASVAPLLIATAVLAVKAKPTASGELSVSFRDFRVGFLGVWALCVAADWLQGPYVYALYASYGFNGQEIAQLFVAGFGSSMVFGCFVGTFTDRFGRKRCCLLYCVLYIVSCMTKHFKDYWMLMFGRLTGGIATSMLFSCFECWMVAEHSSKFPKAPESGMLGYMFGMMFTVMYCVAILGGLAGQAVADAFTFAPTSEGGILYFGGYCGPFDLAIACLVVGSTLISAKWAENYGTQEASSAKKSSDMDGLVGNLKESIALMVTDRKILLLGVVVSSFEGSMFAFVFNWTPALASDSTPPPHGVIFALFMMACMCGASTSTLVSDYASTSQKLMFAFVAGLVSFILAAFSTASGTDDNLQVSMFAFLLFEFCVGLYFPSIGSLKSEVVPEHVRATVYNFYRVPLNAIVVGLLLSGISMATCFKLNAFLLMIAILSMVVITNSASKTNGGGYSPVQRNDEEEGISMGEADPVIFGKGDLHARSGQTQTG